MRIGVNAGLAAPKPASPPTLGVGDPRRGPVAGGMREFAEAAALAGKAVGVLGSATLKVGALVNPHQPVAGHKLPLKEEWIMFNPVMTPDVITGVNLLAILGCPPPETVTVVAPL